MLVVIAYADHGTHIPPLDAFRLVEDAAYVRTGIERHTLIVGNEEGAAQEALELEPLDSELLGLLLLELRT